MKKTLSILLCLAMLFSIVSINGPILEAKSNSVEFRGVPEGFCESEYLQLVEFFAIADENGVTNGEKLNPAYDPNDPSTWTNADYTKRVWYQLYPLPQYDGLIHFYGIDLGGLDMVGELNLNNFINMQAIDIEYTRITAVHTENNPTCTRLDIDGNENICFDLTGLPNLVNLQVKNCNLDELDLSMVPRLTYLYCTDNNISELDLSNQSGLWFMYCERNQLTELDFSNNTRLGLLHCEGNQLTELDLSASTQLSVLRCADNALTSVTLPETSSKLGSVDFSNNNLTEFVCLNAPKLEEVKLRNNQIEILTLPESTRMRELDVRDNQLTGIDVSMYPSLKRLLVGGNPIESIDLSSNNTLYMLDVPYMEGIELVTNGDTNQSGLTNFPFEAHIFAEEGGLVQLTLAADQDLDSPYSTPPYINGRAIISARANDGYTFIGWFDENDNLVSSDEELTYTDANLVLNLTAKFEAGTPAPLPGDVNGDGMVSIDDALLILRHTLDIAELTDEEALLAADYNGDGNITTTDALLALRASLDSNQ